MDIRVVAHRKTPKFAALWLGDPDNWKRFLDSPHGDPSKHLDGKVLINFEGKDEWTSVEHLFWILPLRPDVNEVLTEEMKSEDMFESTSVRPVHMKEYSRLYFSTGQLQPQSLRSTSTSGELDDLYDDFKIARSSQIRL